mmetsp:Transcript_21763/g.47471  ORF Transcript_21763/g.47471 Transcript_21763/m.47471 type:complete len:533 (-) Transcript_21763:147-1745(-)
MAPPSSHHRNEGKTDLEDASPPVCTALVFVGDVPNNNAKCSAVSTLCISCSANLAGRRRALLLPSGTSHACMGCLRPELARLAPLGWESYPSLGGQTFFRYEDIVPSAGTGADVRTTITVRLPPIDQLGTELLALILGYLDWTDIMKSRVCVRLKEASRMAKVRLLTGTRTLLYQRYSSESLEPSMARKEVPSPTLSPLNFERIVKVLPIIEELDLREIRGRPSGDAQIAETLDLNHLASYRFLKRLHLRTLGLGRAFPILTKLVDLQVLDISGSMEWNPHLKLDLKDLSGLRNLEYLNVGLCRGVTGNLLSVADFPCLRVLNVGDTKVTGDIRQIGPKHFCLLETLETGYTSIFGGSVLEFGDATAIAGAWRDLILQRVECGQPLIRQEFSLAKKFFSLTLTLTRSSLSFDGTAYEGDGYVTLFAPHALPLHLEILSAAGLRFGYRWTNKSGGTCDVVWIDAEPDLSEVESIEEQKYRSDLRYIEEGSSTSMFRGHLEPPTPAEYKALLEHHPDMIEKHASKNYSYLELFH